MLTFDCIDVTFIVEKLARLFPPKPMHVVVGKARLMIRRAYSDISSGLKTAYLVECVAHDLLYIQEKRFHVERVLINGQRK